MPGRHPLCDHEILWALQFLAGGSFFFLPEVVENLLLPDDLRRQDFVHMNVEERWEEDAQFYSWFRLSVEVELIS